MHELVPPGDALTASLTVAVLAGRADDVVARPAGRSGETWQRREAVRLASGPAVRVFGVEDVDLPGGRWVRTVLSQLYVPLPGEHRVALVSCSTTAVDLAEAFLSVFEAIGATFMVLPEAAR